MIVSQVIKERITLYVLKSTTWEDAPLQVEIKGNVSELTKLRNMIDCAISYVAGKTNGFDEDDIDTLHFTVEAYSDDKKLREKIDKGPSPENPFGCGK